MSKVQSAKLGRVLSISEVKNDAHKKF